MLSFQYPFRPDEDYSSSWNLVYNSTRCSAPEITSLLQDTKLVDLQENEKNLVCLPQPDFIADIMENCNSEDIGEDIDDFLPVLIPDNQHELYMVLKHRRVQIPEYILDELSERKSAKWGGLTTEDLYPDILMNANVM